LPITILIKKEVVVKIDSFSPDLKDRVKKMLKELETTWPMCRLDIKKLKGYDNHYRIRVGDYRVLFFREGNIAKIYDVSHRRDVYK
jgi:mRNA interferase RelE/StbE